MGLYAGDLLPDDLYEPWAEAERERLRTSHLQLLRAARRWTELLAALRALRVPRTFVLVIGMTYRYLIVMLDVVADMHESRRSRVVAPRERSARECAQALRDLGPTIVFRLHINPV